MEDEIQELLSGLPLNTVVEFGDDRIYLNVYGNGAELGVRLTEGTTYEEMRTALQNGFASAMEFDAGVAYMPDGSGLALMRWLPEVRSWISAYTALEVLLNQLETWREWLAPPKLSPASRLDDRYEKKMRSLVLGRRQ